jgi:hypothetical protein
MRLDFTTPIQLDLRLSDSNYCYSEIGSHVCVQQTRSNSERILGLMLEDVTHDVDVGGQHGFGFTHCQGLSLFHSGETVQTFASNPKTNDAANSMAAIKAAKRAYSRNTRRKV